MKYLNLILFLALTATVFSCQDNEKARLAETKRTKMVNDSIFKVISDNWKFDVPPPTAKVAQQIGSWNEWQQFNNELHQKPTGSLEAFRQKTKTLVNKADQLRNNIPAFFNKPQVRSRLGVLIVTIQSLYTYISIETIPDKKVVGLINEVTKELTATQNQFDEMIRYSEIRKEEGEEQMLKALDTVRMANPGGIPGATPPAVPGQAMPVMPHHNTFTGHMRSPGGHGAGYIKPVH